MQLTTIRNRLRQQSGLATVELMLVVWAWLLAMAFLFDMATLLGNGMVLQAALNRAAIATTAEGCVSAENASAVEQSAGPMINGLKVLSTYVASGNGTFDHNAAMAAIQDGANPADCQITAGGSGGDTVSQNSYILIDLEYDQHLLLFPTIHVHKTALALSSSFNLEGNGP